MARQSCSRQPQVTDMPLNICPVIPRTFKEEMDDTTVDVTVIGRGVRLVSVEVNAWMAEPFILREIPP